MRPASTCTGTGTRDPRIPPEYRTPAQRAAYLAGLAAPRPRTPSPAQLEALRAAREISHARQRKPCPRCGAGRRTCLVDHRHVGGRCPCCHLGTSAPEPRRRRS